MCKTDRVRVRTRASRHEGKPTNHYTIVTNECTVMAAVIENIASFTLAMTLFSRLLISVRLSTDTSSSNPGIARIFVEYVKVPAFCTLNKFVTKFKPRFHPCSSSSRAKQTDRNNGESERAYSLRNEPVHVGALAKPLVGFHKYELCI